MLKPTIHKKYNSYEYLRTQIPNNYLYEVETIGHARIIDGYCQCKTNQVATK